MQTAIYLFCLARTGRLQDLVAAGFNGESPILTRDFADITAVVSEVSLDEFCGPEAEDRLQDVRWLGPRAVRHEQVIESAMQYSPVLPARFGALFSSMDALEEVINRTSTTINAFFDSVKDKDEWAVRIFLSRTEMAERLFSEKLAEHTEMLAPLSKGVRYFRERQLRAEVEKDIRSRVKEVTEDIVTLLTEFSADRRKREVIFRGKEEDQREIVANWAFLVGRDNTEDFRVCVSKVNAQYNDSGLFFDVSGPWPPYSFTPVLPTEPEA
jgi:hypothetical protein